MTVEGREAPQRLGGTTTALAITVVAVTWALLQLYVAVDGFREPLIQRPLHVSFATTIAFLLASEKSRSQLDLWFVRVLAIVSMVPGIYLLLNEDRVTLRISFVDPVLTTDIVLGFLMVGLLIEAGRRLLGLGLAILALIAIAYAFVGPLFSGFFRHAGMSLESFIDLQFLSASAIYGIPTGISTEVVFYFVLFAAFLDVSGGGRLIIDFALSALGGRHAGPAKAAVIASGGMGSISGSAVGNVVSTGVFTIPLMRRSGFSKEAAGATEAVASTGGQLMPPIMGAGAFIMAELTGVPYVTIAVAAIVPALLFYWALYNIVGLEARRTGVGRIAKEDLPKTGRDVLLRLHLLIGPAVLIYLLLTGTSLTRSATISIAVMIVISYLRRATWLTPTKVLQALRAGAVAAVTVAIPCAIAGIVIGVVVQSGLGLKLSSLIIGTAGHSLLLALIVVMIGAIILGMGMPTTAAYILAAVLLAPALQDLGVSALAAHMFVFIFAILSMVTPPIALAAYAAAGISGASATKTGYLAFKYSLAGFIIPFGLVYNEGYFLMGDKLNIAVVVVSGALGVVSLAFAVVGFIRRPLTMLHRLVFFAGAVLLIQPNYWFMILGFALSATMLFWSVHNSDPEETESTDVPSGHTAVPHNHNGDGENHAG